MPPRLRDYDINDWLHVRPVIHQMKTRRYRYIDRHYSALPALSEPSSCLRSSLKGKRVLVSIAFTDPQTIDWQAQLVKFYVPDVIYIVADNTRDDAQAAQIAAVAAKHAVPYLRLPKNPWNEPSRSHGLALNWVWRNLIRPGEPQVFGFLDDDMYPTATNDPFAALRTQDWFGVVRPEGPPTGRSVPGRGVNRWFLWAGFSMFKFEAVVGKPLDFSQDWFLRLDTGGANWSVLYQHVPRHQVREQETIFVPYKEGLSVNDAPFQWCGVWLHEVGFMGRPEFAKDKRRVIADVLAPYLDTIKTASAR